ncbi:DNA translocase FtsK [Carnobacteriaceae bacterium zg-ZUI252]|nr:DNA translocase FtsK [Carnobacteriaceae bacterium zg-ZUI252]QTU83536.1 DNA translocase FtsK [Carnobacteriaceae bacterium zg-C25]
MAKKRKKQQVKWRVEYTTLLVILVSVLAIFSWGFIGQFMTNLFRFVVGGAYIPISVVLIVYCAMLLFRVPLPNAKIYISSFIILMNILILLSLNDFPYETNLLGKTLQNASADLVANQQLRLVGGGLIGALFSALFVFAFSVTGAYFVVVFTSLIALAILYGKPISFYSKKIKQFSRWVKTKHAEQKTQQPKVVKPIKTELSQTSPVVSREEILEVEPESSSFVINGMQMEEFEKQFTVEQEVEPVENEGVEDESDALDTVTFSGPVENEDYQLPPLHLLNDVKAQDQSSEYEIIKKNSRLLEETFKSFGVNARVISANLGPSVTKFEIQPAVGVKVSKIVSLSDDIALALAAKDIRIEAPIPGKSYIGIEVPNQSTSMVSFREIIEDNIESTSKLNVPLGRDISGNIRMADLSKMPHLLVAGATGSGKSVAINGMITSILMKAKPNEVKLMMIDPKKVELNVYNGIPHLLTPVVTNPRRAAQALQKAVVEMERRYELFAQTGMRNITGYNEQVDEYNLTADEPMQKLPYIVVIVDELADLMMVASNEVEAAIIRLAQMARAAGIHMVLATQRPSVDVITGLIKANVPSRMAFAVSSSIDSRTIIDSNGAEKLLGKGDMLFMPMGENKPVRVQGAFLSDQEVERVVEFVKTQQEANYVEEMMPSDDVSQSLGESSDELFDEIVEFLADQEFISVSMLQRKFRIGFNRAARLMEELEEKGIVGPAEGTKPRKVLGANYTQD